MGTRNAERATRRPMFRVLAVATLAGLAAAGLPADTGRCAYRTSIDQTRPVSPGAPPRPTVATPSPTPSSTPTPTGPTPTCPYPGSGFDCARQRAFAAAEKYLAGRPGHTAVVVRDRVTGAVWRNAYSTRPIWTASTIKLAIAVDLLVRDHAGAIRLAAGEHTLVQRMLRASSDSAATTLWWRYDGRGAPVRYDAYGMTGLTFPGDVYWGSAKATADDLDRLVNHTLDALPAHLTTRIVADLRAVTPNQQWGVWGVGPAAAPGNTNGWWGYSTGWVINSVGFLGPAQRFTLTLMNDLAGEAGYDAGVATTTHVATLIFAKTL